MQLILTGTAIIAILVLTLWRYLPIWFTDNDSMEVAIRLWHDDYLAWLRALSERAGRITGYPNYFIAPFPYLSTSFVWYKACAYAALLGTLGLFYLTVRVVTASAPFALLGTVLFLAIAVHPINHSLFTGYYFFQLWAMSVCATILLFHHAVRTDRRALYWAAFAVWCASLLLAAEEDRFLYGVFLVFIALDHHWNAGPRAALRETARLLWPHAASVAVLAITVIVFRLVHPSEYIGNQLTLSSFSIRDYFQTLYTFTVSALPGYTLTDPVYARLFEHFGDGPAGLPGLWHSLRAEWVVRGLLVAALTALCLSHAQWPGARRYFLFLPVMLLVLLLPNAGLAFSRHYQELALAGNRVMTHFTFFVGMGYALIFGWLFAGIVLLTKRVAPVLITRMVTLLLATVCAAASIVVDYGNHHVAEYHTVNSQKWLILRDLVQTGEFQALPEGTVLCAPSLWNPGFTPGYYRMISFTGGHMVPAQPGEANFWEKFIAVYSGKRVRVVESLDDAALVPGAFHYLRYVQANTQPASFAVLSPVVAREDKRLFGNSAILFSLGPDRRFEVLATTKTPGNVRVTFGDKNRTITPLNSMANVDARASADALVTANISGAAIDLDSIQLSTFAR